MRFLVKLLLAALLLPCSASVWGANDPYIGYIYPAGGRQGTVVRVKIGGQRLKNVDNAVIVGGGVSASFVEYESASGPLNSPQKEELRRRINELREKRNKKPEEKAKTPNSTPAKPAIVLPDLPELRDLESKTPKELRRIESRFLDDSKRAKAPIAETVTLDVTIDADAPPGDRELRLLSPSGLSNPMVFQVGRLPEIQEKYDRDEDDNSLVTAQPSVLLNGRIMPGAVDKYSLTLQHGRRLIIAADARHLIPYLADAVPGWFQALITLKDEKGRDVASADHCGYDPDPVISYKVPSDGTYTLTVRDALYRGREDFIYRIAVVDETQGNSLLPLPRRGGVEMESQSPTDPFALSAKSYLQFVRNPLPECEEIEPNDTREHAQPVTLPQIVRGCISKPGDVDTFKFSGHAGEEVVAEVYARRLGSPLDSLLRLTDSKGRVLALNDDHPDPEQGLLTHQSDSYLSAKLPANGTYFVQVSDVERHGGDSYKYFLRISRPQPNFGLRVSPSSINMPAGHTIPITVCAFRKDGWNGEISVGLKDAPAGFKLSGGSIPPGRDSVRMVLIAPKGKMDRPIVMHLEGSARIEGKTVVRPVLPVENMMQAFAYQHLVPSRELLLFVTRNGGGLVFTPEKSDRLRVTSGGQAEISFKANWLPKTPIHLEFIDPPSGVTLGAVTASGNVLKCIVKADSKHVGYADNLIIEAFAESAAKPKAKAGRYSLGILPAVPFEIVK
jgi:hypothetical protein